jgi:hypothetical protein
MDSCVGPGSTSCCANGVEPLAYLTHLCEKVPVATTAVDLEALPPWNVKSLLKATTASKAWHSVFVRATTCFVERVLL